MRAVLHHELHGGGPGLPLLLLRPLAGTIRLWGPFLELLAADRRVVACEPRGVGPSPPLRVPTTIRSMAGDAAELLQHLGITAAHVLGLSLGGMVATQLAIASPRLVRGLVLVSTPARGTTLMQAPGRGLRFARCIARREDSRTECLTRRVLSEDFFDREPARAGSILATARREPTPLRTLVAHAVAGATHDATDDLGRISAPALCVAGQHDGLVGPDVMRELARRMSPPAEMVVVAGAGHDISLEKPAELAACVGRFLREQDSGTCGT